MFCGVSSLCLLSCCYCLNDSFVVLVRGPRCYFLCAISKSEMLVCLL